jgi:hypothetical protein
LGQLLQVRYTTLSPLVPCAVGGTVPRLRREWGLLGLLAYVSEETRVHGTLEVIDNSPLCEIVPPESGTFWQNSQCSLLESQLIWSSALSARDRTSVVLSDI